MSPMDIMIRSMMGRLNGNPMFERAQQMAQGKNVNQIQEVAKNLCKQRGFDFDKMLGEFQNRMMQNQGFFK